MANANLALFLIYLVVIIQVQIVYSTSYCEEEDDEEGDHELNSVNKYNSFIHANNNINNSASVTNRTAVSYHQPVINIIVTPSKQTKYSQLNSTIYLIPKSQSSLEITCISNKPIDWNYIGLGISLQDLNFQRGRNINATCFYYTIVFPNVIDEITGEYICYQSSKRNNSYSVINNKSNGVNNPNEANNNVINSKKVIIFAGNNNDGYLIHRKSGLNIKGLKENNELINFPCATNDPDSKANAILWRKLFDNNNNKPKNDTIGYSKWQQVPPNEYEFYPLTGIQLLSPVYKILENVTRPNASQASFKCDTAFSSQDAIYFIYKPPPEFLVKPATNTLCIPSSTSTVKSNSSALAMKPIELQCFSMKPIHLEFELELDTNLNITELENTISNITEQTQKTLFGYKYGLQIKLPVINESLNISCIKDDIIIIHKWNILISNEDFIPELVFDSDSNTVTCFSKAPESIQFYYVLCELLTKCRFLQPCLQDSPEWSCPENVRKIPKIIETNETSVTIQLLDYSGAFSCIGIDINETIYFHRTANGKLNLDNNQTDLIGLTIIGNNNEHLIIGTLVQVECVASKRFFLNKLSIELWSNGKFSSYISKDSISNDETTILAGMYVSRLQFKIQDITANEIVCVGQRYDSNETEYKSLTINVKSNQLLQQASAYNWTTVTLAIIAILFLIIVIVVTFFWRQSKKKLSLQSANSNSTILTDLEFELLQRFRDGCSPTQFNEEDLHAIQQDGNYYAQIMPYDKNQHEISLDKLKIDHSQILGTGEYGIVFKGILDNGTFGVPVAVKELKANAQYIYLKALLAEIKIMIYVGKHENIAEFLGACTQRKLDVCIVLRLYPHGTMEKYLRDHRQHFHYQNCLKSELVTKKSGSNGYVNPTELNVADLLRWSFQVSNALEYLFHKKVIHGDLSSRNILLDETMTAKVSDFGLARQRYQDLDFPKLCDMPLPWRWMSLESLRYLEFSQESDVWSFGVTLWEIFSLAEIPYLGKRLDSDFLLQLENGYKLEKPAFASDTLYEIMTDCWLVNPNQRSKITEVKQRLEKCLKGSAEEDDNNDPNNIEQNNSHAQELNYRKIHFEEVEEE